MPDPRLDRLRQAIERQRLERLRFAILRQMSESIRPQAEGQAPFVVPPLAELEEQREPTEVERRKAQILLSGPLTGFLGRGPRTVIGKPLAALNERLLGRLPGRVGEFFEETGRGLREKIETAEQAERFVRREGQVGKVPAISSDVGKFVAEFEAVRAIPGLRGVLGPVRGAAPSVAGRLAQRAGTEAGQFGTIETGISLLEGEGLEEAARRGRFGAAAGAVLGPIVGGAGEAFRVVRLRRVAEAVKRQREFTRQTERAEALERTVGTAELREQVEPGIAQLRRAEEAARATARLGTEAPSTIGRLAEQFQTEAGVGAAGARRLAAGEAERETARVAGQRGRSELRQILEEFGRRAEAPQRPVKAPAPAVPAEVAPPSVRVEAPTIEPPTTRTGPLAKLSDEKLMQRLIRAEEQAQREAVRAEKGITSFARQAPELGIEGHGVVTGTAISGGAARALGRKTQAGRRIDTALEELRARRLPEEQAELLREGVLERKAIQAGEVGGDASFVPEKMDPFAPLRSERGAAVAFPDPLERRVALSKLSAHSRRVQRQIDTGRDPIELPSVVGIYTRLVRKTAGIERAEKVISGGLSDTGPGTAAQLTSGSARRAEGFLEIGPAQWTAEGNLARTGTPAFQKILEPLRGKLNEFRRYEVSARTVEVGQRRIETGIALEDAQREVAGAGALVRRAHEESVRFRGDVFDYWAEAGGISPEAREVVRELGKDYVSLTRVFRGRDIGKGVGRVGRVPQAIKRLKGSKRPIQDPIRSTVEYTQRLIRAADLNRVGVRLIELAERFPEESLGIMERVTATPRALSREASFLANAARARGITISDDVAAEIAGQLSTRNLTLADDIIHVWRNGTREQWRVAPEIAAGIRAMGPQEVQWWVQLIGAPAQIMKTGVTLNPAFQFFNFIRDTFDATLQSQYGFKLGIDSFKGFYQSAKANWLGTTSKAYEEFVLGGGGFTSLRGARRLATGQQLRRIIPRAELRKAAAKVVHPLEALQAFGQPFEEAARVGEFMLARKAKESVVRSILASKNVTVDFQQVGSTMRALAHMTAFLNPAVQSLDRMMRVSIRPVTKALEVKRAGAGPARVALTAGREATRLLAVATGAITIPSVLLWVANRNDQEINDLRKTNAGLIYWFFRWPNGEIGRLPKPFLWGQIFGTGAESALDTFADSDPEAADRFAEGVWDQTVTNIVPNLAQIIIEQKTGIDTFTGAPIVPRELEGVEPRFQSKAYTGLVARKLGDRFNISPARIESVWRDLMGTLGARALELTDRSLARITDDDTNLPPVPADNPVIGRFFARVPNTNVQPMRRFYKDAGRIAEVMKTLRLLEKTDLERASQYIDDHELDIILSPMYEGMREELGKLRKDIQTIRVMPSIKGPEKRELTDQLIREMVELTRALNDAILNATQLAQAG